MQINIVTTTMTINNKTWQQQQNEEGKHEKLKKENRECTALKQQLFYLIFH